jgi:nicotinate-nucleotide pyrophosphorylase (carboxylating)
MDHRRHYTSPVRELHRADVETLIRLAIAEDAPEGDVTSESIFDKKEVALARIVAREEGVYCGMAISGFLLEIFREVTGYDLMIVQTLHDGDRFHAGDTLLSMNGSLPGILRVERPLLNFVQYLSGIATTTAAAVAKAGPDIAILDTRKTLPGYRRMAKYAVYCGGGTNHRIHLSDMAMIKDNHIEAAGSITLAVQRVRARHPAVPLEIEIDRLDQLEEALSCRPRVLLLDNMDSSQIRYAMEKIQSLPAVERPFIELSGGWRPERFSELAGYGWQGIGVSMGYLTHTTRFLDLSLEIRR